MKTTTLRIATRQSPMALHQAQFVKQQLEQQHPNLQCEIIGMTTQGDRDTSQPLTSIGGKALFVKEIQQALLQNQADIAVHCVKDMSVHDSQELQLAAILPRDAAHDVLVHNTENDTLDSLPPGSIIGTSSPRRTAMLLALRPDFNIQPIRGNVNTRLAKLDAGEFDVIILAAAGLIRLNLAARIKQHLSTETFIPAIGQGALAIECRRDDNDTRNIIAALNHPETAAAIAAERQVNRILGGDCHSAIAAYATITGDKLVLSAWVASLDGKHIIQAQAQGNVASAETIGTQVANDLIKQGALNCLNPGV